MIRLFSERKLLIFLLVAAPCLAHAQHEVDYTLGEIVVTATRLPDPPYGTDTFSQLALRHPALVTTAAHALNTSPSMQVSVGSKGEARLYLRGFSQREVVLLFDGHPIYEPYFGTMDLGQFPLGAVAKIKVAKGPASSLYGPNALGGVVNLVSFGPPTATELWASVVGGNGGYRRVSFRHGGRRQHLYYWIVASRAVRAGFRLPAAFTPTEIENGDLRNNSDVRCTNLYGKLGWQLPGRGQLALSAGATQSMKGVPLPTRGYKPRYWRFPDWQRRFVDLTGKFQLRSSLSAQLKVYREAFQNTLDAYTGPEFTEKKWSSTYHNHVSGLQGLLGWDPLAGLHFSVSLSSKKDVVQIQDDTGLPWKTYRASTVSAGLETHWTPRAALEAIAGASMDRLESAGRTPLTSVNPQVGLVYRFAPVVSIRLLSGLKSRFPTLKEWYNSLSGNAGLRPERAWINELALRVMPSDAIQIDAALFHSAVRDLIQQRGRGLPFENLARAHIQGLELAATLWPSGRTSLAVGASVLDASDPTSGRPLNYRPHYKASLCGHVGLPRGSALTVTARAVGSRAYTLHGNGGRLPGYTVLDATLTLPLFAGLKPFVAVSNVFDTLYEDELGYPMPGREIRMGLELTTGGTRL